MSPTMQVRSEKTLNRILDAADALISERGVADASIPEIVRRADSSVGGFYARFRDKNALLAALEERFLRELQDRVVRVTDPGRWSEASIPRIVRACIQELVDTYRERQGLIRAFLFRASQYPSVIEEELRIRRGVSERLRALLLHRTGEIGHPDPEVAIELGVQLAFGLMHQLIVFGEVRVGSRRLSDTELVDELTRNVLAYAGVPPDVAAPA